MIQTTEKNINDSRGEFPFYVPKNKGSITTEKSMGGKYIITKVDSTSEDVKVRLFLPVSNTTVKTFFVNSGDTREEEIDEPVKAEITKLTNDKENIASGVFETKG